MKFTDFTPEELVGKYVINTSGTTYGGTKRSLYTIVSATKTQFKTSENSTGVSYDMNGKRKGLTGRMHMGTIDRCFLITSEEAEQFKRGQEMTKQKSELRAFIKDNLHVLSLKGLQVIESIIKGEQV